MTHHNHDHADKSWLRPINRTEWAVIGWCAAYVAVIAVLDWFFYRPMP